jgi:aspartate kinase
MGHNANTTNQTYRQIMNTLIMKFGGNAVGTVTALTQVLSIILHEEKRWDKLIVVVSALDGVTDMLLEAAHLAQLSNQRGYRRIAATLRTRHLALIDQLPLGQNERHALSADIDHLLFEMLDVCQSVANTPTEHLSAQISDRIIQVGERLSARIVAALLRQNHLRGVAMDGTDIIVTDDIFGNATPQLEPTQQRIETHLTPLLERQIIPVVTGFIGGTADGQVTTMGRGGSDYTASVLSICTQAKEVWLWSDVDGMMSTDPREVDNARVIETLTYQEVAEMAHFGARILHPRMIQPLAKAQIPLRIKNIYKTSIGRYAHRRTSARWSVAGLAN